nr:NAD(P)-binding protein [uncultured Psychrobacter sp.]
MTHSTASTNDQNNPKIAIIGGGLTGLFTATLLERALGDNTVSITIFEKSRSVGRLATRYRTGSTHSDKQWQWDFGAQFFTAKSAEFSRFIAPWLDSGLLQPWLAQVVNTTPANSKESVAKTEVKEQWDTDHARYISTPKMTSWGRELVDTLQQSTIEFKTRVAPLAQYTHAQTDAHLQTDSTLTSKQTELFDESGERLGVFDWVICTAPNVQAFELMAESGFSELSQIMQPKMLACYTLMLGWDDLAHLPKTISDKPAWDVAYMQDSILDRIFMEHQKPGREALLPSITIHARNDWSEQHIDEDIDTIKAQLLVAAQQALNWNDDSAPSQIDCHRWRYAATVTDEDSEPLGTLVDKRKQWIVSGDWCHKGNIESAYLMAQQTVKVILQH